MEVLSNPDKKIFSFHSHSVEFPLSENGRSLREMSSRREYRDGDSPFEKVFCNEDWKAGY